MTSFDWPSWISAGANIVIAFGLLFTLFQVRAAHEELRLSRQNLDHSKEHLRKDHERSRREKAVDLICEWARNSNQRGASARKLVERLSFDQGTLLFAQESFEIEERHRDLVESALAGKCPEPLDGKIRLSEEQSSEVRWQAVTYLNRLEAILLAWQHHVADREMLEGQFGFLISPAENVFVMSHFRQAAGGNGSFPAIEAFVAKVKSQREKARDDTEKL